MILLTGAAGVVGSAFRQRGEHDIVCLRHRRPVDGAGEEVSGDIAEPRLGLTEPAYKALCEKIDTVVHAAATVNLAARPEDYERVNIEGAHRLARFAADAGARLIFISTAFVHDHEEAGARSYPGSKLRAEEIVRAGPAPTSIIRPSIVAGDSASGRIAEEQGFHQAMTSLVRGPIRVVPADQGALIDFVPQDYVAAVIRALAEAEAMPEELWLTSGPRAMTVTAVVAAVNDFIAAWDLPGDPARIVSDDTVERLFVPALLPELPARTRARVKMLLKLTRHMRIASELPCSAPLIERSLHISQPDPTAVLAANLRRLRERILPSPVPSLAQ